MLFKRLLQTHSPYNITIKLEKLKTHCVSFTINKTYVLIVSTSQRSKLYKNKINPTTWK